MFFQRPAGTRAILRVLCVGAIACSSLTAGAASATVVPPDDDVGGEVIEGSDDDTAVDVTPESTVPATTVPAECILPIPVQATFVGSVVESDRRTVRFQIVQMRGGTLDGYEDVRYLEVGESYIVAAGIDASSGRLFSKVREPEPLLGSSQVIGLNSGVNCPEVEDAVRTLDLDGRSVESGVLAPLREATGSIIRSLALPVAWALGALVLVATLRAIGSGFLQASYRYWNGEPLISKRQRRS